VVLIVLIHRVMGYFSERQRLHMFRELLKAARKRHPQLQGRPTRDDLYAVGVRGE
jgi:hypothetical protein